MFCADNLTSDIIRLSENHYARLSDIVAIEKVYAHPNNPTLTTGFPKYEVYFGKDAKWNWILITIEEFEKYVKKYISE